MTYFLTTEAPSSLIDANEKNFLSYTRKYASSHHNHFQENKNLMLSISDIDGVSMISNAVSKSILSEREVANTLKLFKDAGKPVMWSVFPSSKPENIADILKKKRLIHLERNALMHINMSTLDEKPILPEGLSIKAVDDIDSLRDWSKLNTICFGYTKSVKNFFIKINEELFSEKTGPGIHFIAYLNGKPVGTSSVFMADGVAGLYNISTLPEARGRGIGEAVTRFAMSAGKNAGYIFATLQATIQGKPVYEKIGFQGYQHMDFYLKLHGKSIIKVPLTYLLRITGNLLRTYFVKL